MVGLIHRILFDFLKNKGGDDLVSVVREKAEISEERAFRIDEAYSDEEWRRIFSAACETLTLKPEEAEEAFAEYFLKDVRLRFPAFFRMAKNSREFLLRQPSIHNTFMSSALDPSIRATAEAKFSVEAEGDGILATYRSANHHCHLYVSLARRILEFFGDQGTIERLQCQKEGASCCKIRVTWTHIAHPS